jgi:integrase
LLGVCPRTVRRWAKSGKLVTFSIGPNTVRVDRQSVMRLLAASSNEAVGERPLEKKNGGSSDEPRLLRQRGRSRVWTGWVDNREVPLGTIDEKEAVARLQAQSDQPRNANVREGSTRQPWRVYPLNKPGKFGIKFYDDAGRRRLHRIPPEVGTLTQAQAEDYARRWFFATFVSPKNAGLTSASETIDVLGSEISFQQFGELWTTGKLALRYPDHVRTKRSAADDEGRLRLYVHPIIGPQPMSAFEGPAGLELVEKVLAGLPPVSKTFSRASRRHVMQAVNRLLGLAVYPAKLISVNPLPKGFLPKADSHRAKAYLYPSEDEKLLACRTVPLLHRLFFGLLDREGFRVSEALSLRWADIDMERGVVHLDRNKTDEPRTWALDPAVIEALRRWKKRFAYRPQTSGKVFVDLGGNEVNPFTAAAELRAHLKTAGVDRPQLFEHSENRIALRAHDLRATFVTVNLALGKNEAWITDRTGHRSSQMIYKYKRAARTHAELNLGALKPLHEAIPELAEVTA